jgi:hypothetical protein
VRRWLAAAGAGALLVPLLPLTGGPAFAANPITTTTVNDPPATGHALDTFPARDFLSADGLTAGDTVVFEITHSAARGGATTASEPVAVDDTGHAEVNHPGAACWLDVTPNIVAGDTARVVVTDSPNGTPIGTADVTHVADITAGRPVNTAPGTITLKGTAKDTDGAQFADVTAIDARLVAPGKAFAKTGKRDLRAPGTRGASFTYDAPGSATDFGWTATWTGLTDGDVKLALGAEAMGAWLGRDPAATVESTVYETGAGIANGPQAPCAAPKEKLPPLPGQDAEAPSVPTGLSTVVSDTNTVTVNWDAATDTGAGTTGVTNYGVYRNGVPVFTVQNPDGSAPAPTTFVDTNVPPGDYTYTVDAADAIDNRSAESAGADATTTAKGADTVPVVEPPTHPFVLFPSRDMIDVSGVGLDQTARVEVIRDGKLVTSASGLSPDDAGLVEINHVGTNCWSGTTPELRANDIVRATVYNQDGIEAWIEQAHVANVVVTKATNPAPGVIELKGEAYGHDGVRIPLEQLDHRLVSSTAVPFGATGKRSIRADSTGTLQGTMAYDPIDPVTNPAGGKFTIRYTGLDAKDVALAQKVVSVVSWLGRVPAANLELTISETGGADAPGPAGPDCVAPLEPIDVAAPSTPAVSATADGPTREVDVAWQPATDNTYVYGYRVFQDGKQIARLGADATTFTATGVNPGQHTFAVEAFDSASARGVGTGHHLRQHLTQGQRPGRHHAGRPGPDRPAEPAGHEPHQRRPDDRGRDGNPQRPARVRPVDRRQRRGADVRGLPGRRAARRRGADAQRQRQAGLHRPEAHPGPDLQLRGAGQGRRWQPVGQDGPRLGQDRGGHHRPDLHRRTHRHGAGHPRQGRRGLLAARHRRRHRHRLRRLPRRREGRPAERHHPVLQGRRSRPRHLQVQGRRRRLRRQPVRPGDPDGDRRRDRQRPAGRGAQRHGLPGTRLRLR